MNVAAQQRPKKSRTKNARLFHIGLSKVPLAGRHFGIAG